MNKNGVFFFPSCIFFPATEFWVDDWILTNLGIFQEKNEKLDPEKKHSLRKKKIQIFLDLGEWVHTIFSQEKKIRYLCLNYIKVLVRVLVRGTGTRAKFSFGKGTGTRFSAQAGSLFFQ